MFIDLNHNEHHKRIHIKGNNYSVHRIPMYNTPIHNADIEDGMHMVMGSVVDIEDGIIVEEVEARNDALKERIARNRIVVSDTPVSMDPNAKIVYVAQRTRVTHYGYLYHSVLHLTINDIILHLRHISHQISIPKSTASDANLHICTKINSIRRQFAYPYQNQPHQTPSHPTIESRFRDYVQLLNIYQTIQSVLQDTEWKNILDESDEAQFKGNISGNTDVVAQCDEVSRMDLSKMDIYQLCCIRYLARYLLFSCEKIIEMLKHKKRTLTAQFHQKRLFTCTAK
eukprot:593071_1